METRARTAEQARLDEARNQGVAGRERLLGLATCGVEITPAQGDTARV